MKSEFTVTVGVQPVDAAQGDVGGSATRSAVVDMGEDPEPLTGYAYEGKLILVRLLLDTAMAALYESILASAKDRDDA